MRDGRLTRIDEAALLDEIAEEHARMAASMDEADAAVSRLIGPYHEICCRCLAHDVAPDTHQARFRCDS